MNFEFFGWLLRGKCDVRALDVLTLFAELLILYVVSTLVIRRFLK